MTKSNIFINIFSICYMKVLEGDGILLNSKVHNLTSLTKICYNIQIFFYVIVNPNLEYIYVQTTNEARQLMKLDN